MSTCKAMNWVFKARTFGKCVFFVFCRFPELRIIDWRPQTSVLHSENSFIWVYLAPNQGKHNCPVSMVFSSHSRTWPFHSIKRSYSAIMNNVSIGMIYNFHYTFEARKWFVLPNKIVQYFVGGWELTSLYRLQCRSLLSQRFWPFLKSYLVPPLIQVVHLWWYFP